MRSLPARPVVCASPSARADRSTQRHPRGRSLEGSDSTEGDGLILAVIGNVRSAVGLGHAEVGEQERDRFGGHRGTADALLFVKQRFGPG